MCSHPHSPVRTLSLQRLCFCLLGVFTLWIAVQSACRSAKLQRFTKEEPKLWNELNIRSSLEPRTMINVTMWHQQFIKFKFTFVQVLARPDQCHGFQMWFYKLASLPRPSVNDRLIWPKSQHLFLVLCHSSNVSWLAHPINNFLSSSFPLSRRLIGWLVTC